MKEYFEKIRKVAITVFGADPVSKSKNTNEILARYAVIALMSRQTSADGKYLRLREIGDYLKRNHSTVYTGRVRHRELLKFDKDYREKFENMNNLIEPLMFNKPEVITSWGADYLKYRRPAPQLKKEDLHTKYGEVITIGDKIIKFGNKLRTQFELIPGHYMEYEGIYQDGPIEYAIFNCSHHNPDPDADVIFRYAFIIVRMKGHKDVDRFLSGTKALRDIELTPIEYYENN